MNINPAKARLGQVVATGYHAELVINGEQAEPADVPVIMAAIFPNLPTGIPAVETDSPGTFVIPVPLGIAADLIRNNRDFGWTESLDVDGGETLVSIYIPADHSQEA